MVGRRRYTIPFKAILSSKLIMVLILSCPLLGISQNFNKIVAFGDSFTDNGYIDGHGFNRDTNGLVWVEYLAELIQCENVDNRAWGGARTDHSHYLGFNWSGFNWQIDNYDTDFDSDKTLITVWIGVNDYWDNKNDPTQSVKNIVLGLKKLIAKGGKYFVIFNNFDLTLSPGYNINPEYQSLIPEVKKLTQKFNNELDKALFSKKNSLQRSSPEIKIYFIDIYTFMNELVADNDFSQKPWKGSYQFPDPKKYLWYDEWHPMTSCHKKISQLVLKKLQN